MADETYLQLVWPPMPDAIKIETKNEQKVKVISELNMVTYLHRMEDFIEHLRLGPQYLSGEVIVPGTQVPGRLYFSITPHPGTGVFTDGNAGGFDLDNTETVRYDFLIGDYIDPDKDIKITFPLISDGADSTEDMKIYVNATKTDNSEALSWNVENATAFTFDSSSADKLTKYTYTLANTNFEKGDMIGLLLQSNVGAGGVVVTAYNALVEFNALTTPA